MHEGEVGCARAGWQSPPPGRWHEWCLLKGIGVIADFRPGDQMPEEIDPTEADRRYEEAHAAHYDIMDLSLALLSMAAGARLQAVE